MKKTAIAIATLAAALGAANASAQAYIGGGVSATRINVDCDGIQSCDKSDTGGKLYGGWGFGNGLSAELGYITFGKATASDSGASLDVKVHGFTVAAAYRAPIASSWGLTGRLGLASLKTKLSASAGGLSASDDERHTAPYFGVAADYAFTPALKLELSADFSRAKYDGEKAAVRSLGLGLRYDF
ncbi:outer membrane beta-barrel protein [Aquincola tertiaricarbonis]|uniref:Outer membrane beta-barrel protein n=1 Tax=Aquincola tertiaricarbonis TaxID=391953 RepID=A0ABY4S1W9_AQUTE|nr:outer membrane beta-barrel protein [Aquincola tertiaricarbonis]URI06610.1 outer membrane beta-barrel protein [Aquincola tertiaricarbonis]